MQPPPPLPPRIPNPLFQHSLRLLHIQTMQINRIAIHPSHGVVFPEDVIARLLVVRVHEGAVALAFLGELVRGGAVAAGVGLVGLCFVIFKREGKGGGRGVW